MTDEEIDEFLIKINSQKNKTLVLDKHEDISKINNPDYFIEYTNECRVYEYLEEEIGLIRKVAGSYDGYIVYGLTKKGKEVVDIGGWLNYVKKQKASIRRKEEKERFDLSISKLQAKTGWLPYLFSTVGIIISFLAYKNSKENNPVKSQERYINKTNKLIKDIDYPTKDSLNAKGKDIDSLNLSNQ